MSKITCIVVTPEKTALEESADFVALPLYDGEVGIGDSRSPMIGRLGYGEMRLVSGGQTSRYYVDGGFVQVADNVVSVLTDRAIPAADLSAADAEAALQEAIARKVDTEALFELRDRDIEQARAQIRTANRA